MKKQKTKQELLTAFNKSNKQRRNTIAYNAGFNSAEEYKTHLTTQIANSITVVGATEEEGSPVVVHNVNIVDCSGSMCGWDKPTKMDSALDGINGEYKELLADNYGVKYLDTYVTFSGYSTVHRFRGELSQSFRADRHRENGMTALYRTVDEVLTRVIKSVKVGEKTIVKIFTDGSDNRSGSKYSNGKVIKDLISKAEELDITVAFMGTKEDVRQVVSSVGIKDSNTLVHDNTSKGVEMAFKISANATQAYASRSMRGEATLDGFYKQSGTL